MTNMKSVVALVCAITPILVSCGSTSTTCPAPRTPAEVHATSTGRVGSSKPAAAPVALTEETIRSALSNAYEATREVKRGKNADYIPVLAEVDSNLFGIALVTVDGTVYEVGDTTATFSIQSVSKIFTLARLIEAMGAAEVEKRIGVTATGQPFNSIVAIEDAVSRERPPPGNPLVNAGAISAVGLLPAASATDRWNQILSTYGAFAGRPLEVDSEVYASESATNTRNQAIGMLLRAYDVIGQDTASVVDVYTRQCSVSVTAKDLAVMGATLANGGTNPITGQRVVGAETAAHVLAVMATAGLYEDTGTWLFHVGAPAKSGVGGGIVAVVPGRFAIGTFSPPLDEAGNSVRGQLAIEAVIHQLGANPLVARAKAGETEAHTSSTESER